MLRIIHIWNLYRNHSFFLDERSADDLVGRVQLSVTDIMKNPNRSERRTDKLRGFQDADDMPGTLTWTVGYYSKATLCASLQPNKLSETTHQPVPRGEPHGPKTPADHMDVTTLNTPPPRRWKSGILSIVVHHINNLERANLKGATGGDREGATGQDTAEPSEQDDNLPSGYCEIIVNDLMIYKTRGELFKLVILGWNFCLADIDFNFFVCS